MKQEQRDLFKDADGLRALIEPTQIEEGDRTTKFWDIVDLSSFGTLGEKVRVVWAEEQTVRSKVIAGHRQQEVVHKTWIWVTDILVSFSPSQPKKPVRGQLQPACRHPRKLLILSHHRLAPLRSQTQMSFPPSIRSLSCGIAAAGAQTLTD